MTIKQLLAYARENLQVENPAKEARILLCAYLQKSPEWLILNDNFDIKNEDGFLDFVKRRNENEPLCYITKSASFYGRDFFITNGVLIPRPESELLVDKAFECIKNIKNPKILEIGFGSGIISIMIALLHSNAKIIATDINEKAKEVALINAKKFGVNDKIEFKISSFDDQVYGNFDLIVSNPPYIANGELLSKDVLNEPHNALFGGVLGHEMIEEIIKRSIKKKTKYLCVEMGYDQKNVIEKILIQNAIEEFDFYKDLSGLDRGFVAKIK